MNGVITVGTADPGPAVDPGKPWETGEEPPDPNALPNDTTAPTVFEEGDNTPPTLELLKATPTEKGAKARIEVAEPVTVTVRLKKGKKIVATKRVTVDAGQDERRRSRCRSACRTSPPGTACRCGRPTAWTSTRRSASAWIDY